MGPILNSVVMSKGVPKEWTHSVFYSRCDLVRVCPLTCGYVFVAVLCVVGPLCVYESLSLNIIPSSSSRIYVLLERSKGIFTLSR